MASSVRERHLRAKVGWTRSFDGLVWLPAIAALALFAPLNQNFGFDPPGWLDAFYYVGYFWHYPEHLPLFDNYYKISRLPWILPGFVAHQFFPPVAASYLLHWATLSGSGVALYLLLRSTLADRAAAATAAVAWVGSTATHGPGGWNYHAVAGAGYYLAACWLVVRHERQGQWRPLVALAGAAFAAAVHTNLFLATFAPLIGWLYLVARLRTGAWTWYALGLDAIRFGIGSAGLTLLLMLINRASGGSWLFFMPQIAYSLWIAQPGNNSWYFEVGRWLPTAKYLVTPLLCLLAGTLALRSWSRDEPWRFSTALVLQGWVALLITAYYQFAQRQSVLDHDYMAFVINANAFAAFGVALSGPARKTREIDRGVIVLVAVAAGLIVGALVFGMPTAMPVALERLQALFGPLPLIVSPLVTGSITAALVSFMPGRVRLVAWALWFSVLNVWLAPSTNAYGIGTPGIDRSMLSLFRQADEFTSQLDPSLDAIEYWFPPEQVMTAQGTIALNQVFDSYVSVRGWLGNLLAGESPGRPVERIGPAQLEGVTCIGLLSSIPRHAQLDSQLRTHVETLGVDLLGVGSRRFEDSQLSFQLTVYRVRRSVADTAAAGTPPCSR